MLFVVGRVSVMGVPDSAGSYAAGQEQAPAVVRAAGLIEALAAAGLDVHDGGDLPKQIWKPDRSHPYAQNAGQVVTGLPAGPLAVHVDVDVLDFTDAPLAEDTGGRNTGPSLDQLGRALIPAARDPRLRALSVGEFNPTRAAADPGVIQRFVGLLGATLAATQ